MSDETENIWDKPDFIKAQDNHDIIRRNSNTAKGFSPNLKAVIGLCHDCGNYQYIINDVHQIVFSRCYRLKIMLGKHSVKECSTYKRRGELHLEEMYRIARKIDPENIKDTPGFLTKNEKSKKDA